MNAQLPFDPHPRPGEVEQVLRRVHRRRAVRAAGSGTAVAVVAAAVLSLGGGGTQVLLQDDVPIGPAATPTETSSPSMALPSAPPTLPPAPPANVPSQVRPTAGVLQPEPRPEADEQKQAQPAKSPAPPQERPRYAGQIGPHYTQYEATDCVVVGRSADDGIIRNDYCLRFVSAGSKDLWMPSIRICRVYDSTTAGRITFPRAEEADFALYRGRQGANGPVAEELLFRFSDTVRYEGGPHGLDVEPGDCWTWRLRLPIDFEAYPADAGFVGEWRTYSEQFPATERIRRTHFTAGSFHGDDQP